MNRLSIIYYYKWKILFWSILFSLIGAALVYGPEYGINQRVRWSSNSKAALKSNPLFFGFLLSAFLANCCILYSIILPSSLSIFLITIKFFLEAFVIFIGSRLFLTSVSITAYIIWNLAQPIYIPIVGISGLIGKYSWKE